MRHSRHRPIWFATAGLILIWLAALGGYSLFRQAAVTSEKVAAFLNRTDLSALTGDARTEALRELARMMNSLGLEERRKARLEDAWQVWFQAMTEEEKAWFIEATMPTGFKQMLASFEKLPADKRQQAVEDSLAQLKRTKASMNRDGTHPMDGRGDPTREPELSPELREKVVQIGLTTFYNESSAQTKAELAPLLEEMQRLMERGAPLRTLRRGP